MGANIFASKTYRKDKLTGELYTSARREEDMRIKIRAKTGKFERIEVPDEGVDYSKCLSCGGKDKEPRWKLTHFCSLKCFDKYGRKPRDISTTSAKDLAGIRAIERELELAKNTW